MVPNSLTDVVERLYRDFDGGVEQCREELDAHSHDALPELVERLARQRLTDLTERPE